MSNTLTDLYNLLAPQVQTEEEKLILERNKEIIDCVERQLSAKDIDSFMNVQAELSLYREETAFAMGFQLAVRVLTAAWQ